MSTTHKLLRGFLRHCWLWIVVFVIATALVLSAARILLPQAERYHAQIETQLSQLLGQPVTIEEFDVGWHGLGPRLYLKDVQVVDEAVGDALFSFEQAHVDISVLSSLKSGELDFGAFTLVGLDLNLIRREDGSLGLEGIELPKAAEAEGEDQTAAPKGDETIRWLWRQGDLALEDSIVQFRDMKAEGRLWRFEHVHLHLSNQDSEFRLSGRMRLPEKIGRELHFVLDVERHGQNISNWASKFYLNADGVQLANLFDGIESDVRAEAGELAGRLWGEWRDGSLADLRGDVSLSDLLLTSKRGGGETTQRGELDQFSSRFVWKGNAKQWVLDLDQLRVGNSEDQWPGTRAHVEFHQSEQSLHVEGGLTFLRLDNVTPLVLLAPQLSDQAYEALTALNPRGEISNTFFRFFQESENPPELFLQTVFNDAAIASWKRLPGFEGLDGSINLDAHSGVVDFSTQQAELDSGGLFRDRLPLSTFDGRIAWLKHDDGLYMNMHRLMLANDDAAAEVDGRLYLPNNDQSPQISLVAQIDYGDASMTSRYLPTRVMPPNTVKWLDDSIISGFITDGGLVLHGPVKKFPFNSGEGHFEVRANLVDGILDYSPGWPEIEQIEAELAFIGNGMEIRAHRAEMLNTELENVRVVIASMRAKPATLEISGRAMGGTEDVVQYLNESPPLHRLFGSFLEGAEVSGTSDLRIGINLPLAKGAEVAVNGYTHLEESTIDFKRLNVDLSDINGRIGFSNQGLTAENVALNVMGQPASVDIRSQENGYKSMVFEASGTTRYLALEERFGFIPVFGYLDGQSPWQALLTIPRNGEGEGNKSTIDLSIKSELVGTSVILPEPLHKNPEDPRLFVVDAQIDDKSTLWRFDYDQQRMTGVFDAPREGALRGELHFAGDAVVPSKSGLRVAGSLESFSQEDWWPVIFADEGKTGAPDGKEAEGVNQLLVEAKHANLFGQEFKDVSLDATREGDVWSANVASDKLKGLIYLPDDWALPLKADLEYFHLPAFGDEEKGEVHGQKDDPLQEFDPSTLPPLNVKSKELTYGGESLGRMELVTEKRLNGMSVNQLKLNSNFANITASGAWNYVGGQHNSILNADIDVKDLGQLLTALGFGSMIGEGHGRSQLKLRWAAPLIDLDLLLLNGSADLDFRDGRVLEVDPGAGRMFSLLSPRRLLLDFRDMGSGLSFDKMRGQFDIRSGNAFSQNFFLDGSVARVEMRGRIGLAAEDYDQEISLTPHVTASLPLIGAVAQASLEVGAIVLLAEKLLKPAIDDAAQMRYTVTGSWDEPQMTRLDLDEDDDGSDSHLPEILREN